MDALFRLHRVLRRLDRPNDDDSENECGEPREHIEGEDLSIGITTQELFTYIALICLAGTVVNTFILISGHLRRFTVPKEQKHCVRIIALPLVFSIISTICIHLDENSVYINPFCEVYEALCVACLFMLCVEFVAPDEHTRDEFFHSQPVKSRRGKIKSESSFHWYRMTYAKVFQFPLVRLVVAFAEIGSQATGRYCQNTMSVKFAHAWVQIINAISTVLAISGLISFWIKFRSQMDPKQKATAKLWIMKSLVGLRVLQSIILGIVNETSFTATSTFTYNDMVYGLPAFLTVVESLLFSIAYYFAFGSQQYAAKEQPGRWPLGIPRGLLSALNITDVIKATFVAIGRLLLRPFVGKKPGPPRRQRTTELNNMAYEPYMQPSNGSRTPLPVENAGHVPEHSMPPQQPYHHVDGHSNDYIMDPPPRYETARMTNS